MNRLISLNDVTDCQLRTSVAPPFLWPLASVVTDLISVCVKLLMAAGKCQNSSKTQAAVVLSVMADVIPLYAGVSKTKKTYCYELYHAQKRYQFRTFRVRTPMRTPINAIDIARVTAFFFCRTLSLKCRMYGRSIVNLRCSRVFTP
jgi:hypothetical protein